jgi:hypothetical protein
MRASIRISLRKIAPPGGHAAKVERIFVIDVLSYDWNCPKFITPRFTAAEVQDAVAPLKARIAELESQLKLQLTMNPRPPLPPFTEETAIKKIQDGRRRLEQPRSRARLARLHA